MKEDPVLVKKNYENIVTSYSFKKIHHYMIILHWSKSFIKIQYFIFINEIHEHTGISCSS